MKLLAHLVAADVRRHRWLLGMWLVVLVASAVLQGSRPLLAAQPAVANTLALLTGLLMVVRLLLRVLLTVLVVQTHPLVGSDAFWLTRPIPPLMLMLAKSIVLGVFLVLAPVAAETVLMSTYSVPPGQMVRVAIDSAVFAALWVTLLTAAAALTPTLARFLLLCGGVLAALALFISIEITIGLMRTETPPVVADPPRPEDFTGLIVFVVLLILACLITLIAQYRNRRLRRSVVTAAVAVVAAVFATDLWPWPFLQRNVERPAWAANEASLSIVAHAEAVRSAKSINEGRAEWRSAIAPVRISGLEPGWSAAIGMLQASLNTDGGRTVTSVSSLYSGEATTDFTTLSSAQAIRGLIGEIYAFARPSPLPPASVLLVVPEAEFARVAPVRGRYRGRFHLQLTHHQVEATLALRPGAEARNGSYRVVLDSALVRPGRMELWLRESDATSFFDRRPSGQRTYYIRNRRSGAAFESRVNEFQTPTARLLSQIGVSIARTTTGFWTEGSALQFPPPWIGSDDSKAPDETWLRDADLIIVRSTREGGVERTLDIDRFPLDATALNETRTAP